MSRLLVEGLRQSYGSQPVLRGVDLDVPAGAVMALLGSSGSGKTTLLRLIAGFEPAEAGTIAMAGRVLEAPGRHVPAERRHIGYVPQEGTLFPHLTVAGNVGFGLPRAERHGRRVSELLTLTGLQALGDRFPHQLSGGQQQRTALARALAPRPELVLLDEPFNALDLDLRRSVCADVIAALRHAGSTALLVTHDPQEGFASADLLAVMAEGVIVQSGDPSTIYRDPASPAVARLTGRAIFLDAVPQDGLAATILGALPLRPGRTAPAGRFQAFLRPEQIVAAPPGQGVPAHIVARSFRGDHLLATVEVAGLALDLRLFGTDPGAALWLTVVGSCLAFDTSVQAGASPSGSSR